MKINWGWKLTIVYLGFMAGILTLVFKAKGQKVDLVATDYYKQELAFGARLEASKNASALSGEVGFNLTSDGIQVNFPSECLNQSMDGQLVIYCPSDAGMDRSVVIAPDATGTQIISKEGLKKGFYIIKASWKMGDKSFYAEKALDIQ